MKHRIFVFFSLLLDLANQYLRGKEEDLNKTDKRESHAESQHPSDVGDERCGRHHLGREKRVNDITFSFSLNLVCFIFREIWGVQKGVDLDQILGGIVHQLLLEGFKGVVAQIKDLVEIRSSEKNLYVIFSHLFLDLSKNRAEPWIASIQKRPFEAIHCCVLVTVMQQLKGQQ